MFNVTTRYVSIDGDRKKAFMIRGDEAYAKTTDCKISISNITTGEVKGFKIGTITVDIYRNVGSSKLFLYDGDEIISSVDVTSSQHTKTFSNVYLSYEVEHTLYAVFKGNDSCLGSKSNKITHTEDLPSSLQTSITFNNPITQISEGGNLTVSVTAKQNDVIVPSNTPVLMYVDETYKTTVNTNSSGVASATLTGIGKGKHTVTASIEDSSTLNATSSSYDISVGYDINFTQIPTPYVTGGTNTTKVSVKDWFGDAVTSGSVSITGISGSSNLNSSGIATFSGMPSSSGNQTATYSGSSSSATYLTVFTPNSISIDPIRTIVGNGYSLGMIITVSGTGSGYNAKVNISINGTSQTTCTLIPNNTTAYTYQGIGRGTDTTVTASIGNKTKSLTIEDVYTYWTPSLNYNFNPKLTDSDFSKSGNGLMLEFLEGSPKIEWTGTDDCSTMEFDVVYLDIPTGTTLVIDRGTGGDEINFYMPSIGDHIKVVDDGNHTLNYYLNGTLVDSAQMSGDGSVWRFVKQGNMMMMRNPIVMGINNLKIY